MAQREREGIEQSQHSAHSPSLPAAVPSRRRGTACTSASSGPFHSNTSHPFRLWELGSGCKPHDLGKKEENGGICLFFCTYRTKRSDVGECRICAFHLQENVYSNETPCLHLPSS